MSIPTLTSTISRHTSPVLAPLNGGGLLPHLVSLDGVTYVSTSIEDIYSTNKETLPSISTAVKNLTIRHAQEIRESIESLQPRIGQNIKKVFRDFFIREGTTIFEFLERPVNNTNAVGQAYQILKRFGKGEYNGNKNKLRDLILDVSSNEIYTTIHSTMKSYSQDNVFAQWIQQSRCIIEQWRKATLEYSEAEKKLQEHCTIFDDIYKRAQILLQLPLTEGYETMIESTQAYLKHAFEKHGIEQDYLNLIEALKKISVLTEMISAIRQIVNAASEPLCSICVEHIVCSVSIPCGHTFCESCSNRQTMTCYICRLPVRERVKIYFS